jgi:hypothetical protein
VLANITISPQINIYERYPGSIAYPVHDRVCDVLQANPSKWWTSRQIAGLPYLGGASIDQVKIALRRLVHSGDAVASSEDSVRYRGRGNTTNQIVPRGTYAQT